MPLEARGIRTAGGRVTCGCEPPDMAGDRIQIVSSSGPLYEQCVLLTAQQSGQRA